MPNEYAAALAAHNAAFAKFDAVRTAYRARKVGVADLLAAKKEYAAATKGAYDAAYTKEAACALTSRNVENEMTDEQKAVYAALEAANVAKDEGLRGYYPRAVIVLGAEVQRLRAMEQRVNVAKAMCEESVGGVIDPGMLRAVLEA